MHNYGVEKRTMYNKIFKRVIDFTASLCALVVLSPILIVTAVLLAILNGGDGAFFLQERPGKDSKTFKIIKFRTMNSKRDTNGNLLPDLQRITPFGSFVRKSSIDELPQLINVLKGNMSLIGPRPLLTKYLPLYNERQRRRHEVKPGITGWAQVNGRNNLAWSEKFELDVWYVDHISFQLDVKIIFLTVAKVFKKQDIVNTGNTQYTIEEFNGHN